MFATFPVGAGVLFLLSRGVGPAIGSQKRELSKASKYANMAISAIDTVKAFNGQEQESWQYFLTAKAITKYYLVQARSNALQFGVTKLLMVALFVQGFWYGLYLVMNGLTIGDVITTFSSCLTAMQAVEVVLPQFLVLTRGSSAGETLKSIMAEMQDGRNTTNSDGVLKPKSCPGDIEVNDVSISSVPECTC
jgi:ATP-binding cassette subfamily B (MDR/TAP) protein 1